MVNKRADGFFITMPLRGLGGFIAGGIYALANDKNPVTGALLGAAGGALLGGAIGGGAGDILGSFEYKRGGSNWFKSFNSRRTNYC